MTNDQYDIREFANLKSVSAGSYDQPASSEPVIADDNNYQPPAAAMLSRNSHAPIVGSD